MTVEFRLLGDVEVRLDSRPVDVGHARQRCVLVALLADAERPVPVDQLLERVWGDNQPLRPRDTLHSYISRLRRMLAATSVRVIRQSGGYVVTVDAMAVDLHHFRHLISQAQAAADDEQAGPLFEQALALWRGEAFATLDTLWVNNLRDAVDAERSAAELDRNDVELRRGHHTRLLADLDAGVVAHPLDERRIGQLMLALYRCGRQADALDHYRQSRRRLTDELGTDPGPALQELHRQILSADTALSVSTPIRSSSSSKQSPMPRQLPAAPRLFVGRGRELAELSRALDVQAEPGGTVVISAIGGAGGIGKTWLAMRWAHDNLGRFPDGQLYVDLRGFDPSEPPVPPPVAVRGFLDALGAEPAAIPIDPDAQTALYRSLVADKRMLIVLDNARNAAQVLPLLPGAASSAVLVTSRHQLNSLVTTHGAQPLALDILADNESRELLIRHLGSPRVTDEPEAVSNLLARCAGLPLALSIMAARAAAQPEFPLAVLAEEMQDTSTRLDVLDAGELSANLAAVFDCSYQALKPETAQVFALLGIAPSPDISLHAAASMTRLSLVNTRRVMQELHRAHLMQEYLPGRYRMHDLVRLYAARQAIRDHDDGSRTAALLRLVDFYLHTACDGDRLLYPYRPPIDIDLPSLGCLPYPLADRPAAMMWFNTEHACILAAQKIATEQGWDTHVWQLAWALTIFHWRRGHIHDHFSAWQAGLVSADRSCNAAAQAEAHRLLGHAYGQSGMHDEALDHLEQALTLSEQLGDGFGQGHTHQLLAWAWEQRGENHQALPHASRALRIAETLGNPVWMATALDTIGWCHALLGDYKEAHGYCQQALDLHRQHRHQDGEAETLKNLGYIAHHAGNQRQAIDHYHQALVLLRAIGDIYAEADALEHLADAHDAIGQHHDACRYWHQALELYRSQRRARQAQHVQERLEGERLTSLGAIRS
jgi:DNA-binding SARP family transcriptional activator/tetratricopeptide (TPR) repeat protein